MFRASNFGIMRHCDAKIDLNINVGHDDIYYAPNFEEFEEAYCFRVVRPSVHTFVRHTS